MDTVLITLRYAEDLWEVDRAGQSIRCFETHAAAVSYCIKEIAKLRSRDVHVNIDFSGNQADRLYEG